MRILGVCFDLWAYLVKKNKCVHVKKCIYLFHLNFSAVPPTFLDLLWWNIFDVGWRALVLKCLVCILMPSDMKNTGPVRQSTDCCG